MQRFLASVLLYSATLALIACAEQKPAATATPATDAAKGQTAAAPMGAADDKARAKEQVQAALDAYVYGYSLMTTDVTRIQMSNVPKQAGLQSPMGQFPNIPRYPPADYRGVSAPNADTLYSLGWVDLSEPVRIRASGHGEAFLPLRDGRPVDDHRKDAGQPYRWRQGATYLLTGPTFKGEVPKGMTQIAFPTRYVTVLGRTYANGTQADYKAVNALQAKYTLTPLASYGKPFKYVAPPVIDPGFSMTAKPQEVILGMDASNYFNRVAKLMCTDAPPAAEDAPMVAKMATLGIVPCQPFDMHQARPCRASGAQGPCRKPASRPSKPTRMHSAKRSNGWVITKGLGRYGTDYMKRAVVAAFGWPANLQDDAVYPYTEVDSRGQPLDGANKYTLTFAKGQIPPVEGFWSITMYMIDGGWWFVPNALNKFTVSPRNNLKTNPDGSTTLYFQTESPGKEKEANWLPAPKGPFIPMLRMYGPQQKTPSVLDGTWTPPAIVKG